MWRGTLVSDWFSLLGPLSFDLGLSFTYFLLILFPILFWPPCGLVDEVAAFRFCVPSTSASTSHIETLSKKKPAQSATKSLLLQHNQGQKAKGGFQTKNDFVDPVGGLQFEATWKLGAPWRQCLQRLSQLVAHVFRQSASRSQPLHQHLEEHRGVCVCGSARRGVGCGGRSGRWQSRSGAPHSLARRTWEGYCGVT